jgi:hypothetical protein
MVISLTNKKCNMETELKLKARHFKGTVFSSNSDCAVARAAKEQLNTTEVNASSCYLCLNNTQVLSLQYNYTQFLEDCSNANDKNYSEEVIRVVKLTGK